MTLRHQKVVIRVYRVRLVRREGKESAHDDELLLFPGRLAHRVAVFVLLHGTLPNGGFPRPFGGGFVLVLPFHICRPPGSP
eukprot:7755428-Pyramimonas_sp.AAC.1